MSHIKTVNDFQSGIVRLRSALVAFYLAAVVDYEDNDIYWQDIMDVVVSTAPDDEVMMPVSIAIGNASCAAVDFEIRCNLIKCNSSIEAVNTGLCNLVSTAKALKLAAQQDEREKDLYWPNLIDSLRKLVPDETMLDSVVMVLEGLDTDTPVEAKPVPRRRKRIEHLNARKPAEMTVTP